MARSNFRIEQGFEIVEANGTSGIWMIQGAGAPVGTSGPSDDATIGSLWLRNDGEGELYHKIADTSSASDWEAIADESVYAALGVPFDSEDMGVYTGGVLTDNTDQKSLNQELSDAIESIQGGIGGTVSVPAGTPTVISTCIVDDCNGVEWEVTAYETASQATKEFFKVTSLHNGTASADATAFDESVHTKLKLADIAGLTFTPKLTGTGVAQTIGLEISATAAITIDFRRTDIP